MYVLDTNAIIYYLSGEKEAVALIAGIQESGGIIYVPTIVRLELFSKPDMAPTERDAIFSFLESCRYIHLDTAVADIAADVRRLYKLKTPDSVIAASALYTGATLATRDLKGFSRVKGLNIFDI